MYCVALKTTSVPSLVGLFFFFFVGGCFYILTAAIILDCPGLADVMLMPMQCLVFNLLFGNGALICTGHLLGRY